MNWIKSDHFCVGLLSTRNWTTGRDLPLGYVQATELVLFSWRDPRCSKGLGGRCHSALTWSWFGGPGSWSCRLVRFHLGCKYTDCCSTFSQARLAPVCEAMCLSATRSTRGGVGDDFVNEEQGPCSPLLPSSPTPPPLPHTHAHSPLPLTSVSLIPSLSSLSIYTYISPSLFLSLSPQIGPAVHQPSRSSPSCLPSPNEKPHNNTGHRSRERTGCVHNGPVAPSKTIVPSSPALFHHCCRDWKRQTFGEVVEGARGYGGTFPPTYNCLKNHIDKHSNTLLFSLFSHCHCGSLSNSRAIMLFNAVIKVKTETCVDSRVILDVRNLANFSKIWIKNEGSLVYWIYDEIIIMVWKTAVASAGYAVCLYQTKSLGS